ncbi:MAG TPA: hypothetical protein EYO33_06405 [Phycisphaerales bacterium]|nr:hypothetical protein [Phycisphaerales bacterium]
MKTKLLSLLFTLVLGTLPVFAEPTEINGFTWDNPLGPTKVEKLGVEAKACRWPAGVPYKETQLELIVVHYDAETVEQTERREVYQAALGTYLGMMKKPEEVNKTLFFGSTGAREVYRGSIPRKNEIHAFSKFLEDGSFVLVAIRAFEPTHPELGKLIQSVANTFKRG